MVNSLSPLFQNFQYSSKIGKENPRCSLFTNSFLSLISKAIRDTTYYTDITTSRLLSHIVQCFLVFVNKKIIFSKRYEIFFDLKQRAACLL